MNFSDIIGEILWIVIFLGIAFGIILGEKFRRKR